MLQSRREFLKTGLSGALFLTLGNLTHCNRTESRPNILFIMADDHAANAISCYSNRLNHTPNIDRIAQEGIKFENCFCANSICAPSRATILTGKMSVANGVIDNRKIFDNSQPTFPSLLKANGYQTAVVGKWHLKSRPAGFDYWNILPDQGHYYNPTFIEMGNTRDHTGYVTDIITDLSLDWLEQRDPNKPFCLLCHHKATHGKWLPALDHLDLYENKELPLPPTFFDNYETKSSAVHEQEMTIAEDLSRDADLKIFDFQSLEQMKAEQWTYRYLRLNKEQREKWKVGYQKEKETFKSDLKGEALARWKYQRFVKDYLRCVASLDENVGRLLGYLENENLTKDTIVIYTSDQGFFLGEHGWLDKRFMYEEAMRMPLLVRYPKEIEPHSVSTELVQNVDFAETILDYAGLEIPSDMQGHSLRPLLKGELPSNWRKSVYYHYMGYAVTNNVERHCGIRTKRYKLIHFYEGKDEWELYDLENDPYEMNNVIHNERYRDLVLDLKNKLDRKRQFYGDYLLRIND